MRAIIIQDHDARALLDKLQLANFNETLTSQMERLGVELNRQQLDAIQDCFHRRFHYIVCEWLQDQGCDVVRRG